MHSGSGIQGMDLGTAPYWSYTCKYYSAVSIAHDDGDNLYMLDWARFGRTRVLRLDADGRPFEIADFDGNSYSFDPNCLCVTRNQTIFVSMTT